MRVDHTEGCQCPRCEFMRRGKSDLTVKLRNVAFMESATPMQRFGAAVMALLLDSLPPTPKEDAAKEHHAEKTGAKP